METKLKQHQLQFKISPKCRINKSPEEVTMVKNKPLPTKKAKQKPEMKTQSQELKGHRGARVQCPTAQF